jgi:hypothetical protein
MLERCPLLAASLTFGPLVSKGRLRLGRVSPFGLRQQRAKERPLKALIQPSAFELTTEISLQERLQRLYGERISLESIRILSIALAPVFSINGVH